MTHFLKFNEKKYYVVTLVHLSKAILKLVVSNKTSDLVKQNNTSLWIKHLTSNNKRRNVSKVGIYGFCHFEKME